jgi:hypothetical protein
VPQHNTAPAIAISETRLEVIALHFDAGDVLSIAGFITQKSTVK